MPRLLSPLASLLTMLAAVLPASAASTAPALSPTDTVVYVGTYTGEKTKSEGIYAFRLRDTAAAAPALEPLGLAAATPSPAFLEVDPSRRLVFAINELGTYAGQPVGSVVSFAIDPATGKLTELSRRSSGGSGPCHLVLDRTGKNLLVANYGAGSVALLPVAADGRLGEPAVVHAHSGKSVHPTRQTAPHAHAVTLDPAQRFVFVPDLGIDQVRIYRFDAARSTLTPHEPAFASLKPGAGPRHMAFRPDARFAYVLNELDSTVAVFAYAADSGRLTPVETVPTLPAGWTGHSTTAEIAVHPSGRYLYASNRGHDSLAIFAIDAARGTLRLLGHQSTGGKTPRHFALDAPGRLVAMENQNSDTIVLARLDPATGLLSPSPHIASVPSPVCAVFVPWSALGR